MPMAGLTKRFSAQSGSEPASEDWGRPILFLLGVPGQSPRTPEQKKKGVARATRTRVELETRICRRWTMLAEALNHLLNNVLPAARDYERAEEELSAAFARNAEPQSWITEGQQAKRRAAEVAIAIDGLADRAAPALGLTPDEVRRKVGQRCILDTAHRPGCIDRVCAVANAYKHAGPLRTKHPITSESDVLATGAGYGVDAFGAGKFSGVEVLVNQKDGTVRKFLADVPWAVAGWFRFLADHGAAIPSEDYVLCSLRVHSDAPPKAASAGP